MNALQQGDHCYWKFAVDAIKCNGLPLSAITRLTVLVARETSVTIQSEVSYRVYIEDPRNLVKEEDVGL